MEWMESNPISFPYKYTENRNRVESFFMHGCTRIHGSTYCV